MTALQKTIARQRDALTAAETFATDYEHRIPEGLTPHLSFFDNTPSVSFHLPEGGKTEENRVRMLAELGRIFGTEGWRRERAHERNFYHWKRTLPCGVAVTIYQAQTLIEYAQEVAAREWPVMLEEHSSDADYQPAE